MDPEYALNKSLPYLTSRLEDAGFTVQVGFNQTKGTIFLLLNDSVKCSIHELMTKLISAEPDVHRVLIELWVPLLIKQARIGETILNNPDELRRRIRTEFGAFDVDTTPLHSYARQYPSGIALILSLDYETSPFRLDDVQLDQCSLSVDELFYYAQKNTDDLPIERIQQVGPFTCISAQSTFVTAKAANMPELMSRFLIYAPHGLFFMVPANHMLYYAPADPANISEQLTDLAKISHLPVISASRQDPDAVLSRDIFYYSPEGTYETITRAHNPAAQELLTNRRIDEAAFFSSAEQYLYFSHAFGKRFFSR